MAKDIRKKLADDGGSQPSRVEVVKIHKDFNSKYQYFTRTVNDQYESDPLFYLQRPELNALKDIIWKDSVWCCNAPMFEFNGLKHVCQNFNIENKFQEILRLNKIFIFHSITRHEGGDLLIIGKYV